MAKVPEFRDYRKEIQSIVDSLNNKNKLEELYKILSIQESDELFYEKFRVERWRHYNKIMNKYSLILIVMLYNYNGVPEIYELYKERNINLYYDEVLNWYENFDMSHNRLLKIIEVFKNNLIQDEVKIEMTDYFYLELLETFVYKIGCSRFFNYSIFLYSIIELIEDENVIRESNLLIDICKLDNNKNERKKSAYYLLSYGINKNIQDDLGNTALHYCAKNNHRAIVGYLFSEKKFNKKKFDLKGKDYKGKNLEMEVDGNIKNKEGKLAIEMMAI